MPHSMWGRWEKSCSFILFCSTIILALKELVLSWSGYLAGPTSNLATITFFLAISEHKAGVSNYFLSEPMALFTICHQWGQYLPRIKQSLFYKSACRVCYYKRTRNIVISVYVWDFSIRFPKITQVWKHPNWLMVAPLGIFSVRLLLFCLLPFCLL